MDLGLKKLKAVVSGGTKGIGRAIAETLAAEGADVAICARNAAEVKSAVAATASATETLIQVFMLPPVGEPKPSVAGRLLRGPHAAGRARRQGGQRECRRSRQVLPV